MSKPLTIIRITQEIKELLENPVSNCSAGPLNENDITNWRATIFGPEGTPYYGGVFYLAVQFPPEYPFKPPIINFITPIYHCNINKGGGICLDILKEKQWSPALTISKVLLSICSLMADPNPKDPLVPDIAELFMNHKEIHDANASEYTLKYANK
jgi:ubiquitin-conjugating enzyme E2 D/E